MSKLSTEQRHRMPAREFALPGGRFPINDANHARMALSMASRSEDAGNLSPGEAATVRRKAKAVLKHPRYAR